MEPEFTLEVWDSITGQWLCLDACTKHRYGLDAALLTVYDGDEPWRIVKTEIISKSELQPIGS
jgi:hypothetical protein